MNAMLPINSSKGRPGKTIIPQLLADELTRPQGKWHEFWTQHIRGISPLNRLPRGFREPKPLVGLIAQGNQHREPVIKHANDTPLNVADLREAIQNMKAVPAKKR